MRHPSFAVVVLLAIAGCGQGSGIPAPGEAGPPRSPEGAARKGVSELPAGEEVPSAAGQTIYVPAYSHIFTADGARPFNLAVTLSVRNTDRERPIVIASIQYHDRDGQLVRNYLKRAVRLAPLAATEIFVKESDTSGGSSASFLLDWAADQKVSPPVVEAVMIGTASTQGISFVCPGRVIAERSP